MLSLMINLGIIFTSVICVFIATLIVVRKYRLSNKVCFYFDKIENKPYPFIKVVN